MRQRRVGDIRYARRCRAAAAAIRAPYTPDAAMPRDFDDFSAIAIDIADDAALTLLAAFCHTILMPLRCRYFLCLRASLHAAAATTRFSPVVAAGYAIRRAADAIDTRCWRAFSAARQARTLLPIARARYDSYEYATMLHDW